MCQLPASSAKPSASTTTGIKAAFSCKHHNESTFVLQEDDRWGEQPLIYVKVYTHDIVIIDSGCGGCLQTPNRDLTLRQYLETAQVQDNNNEALNPSGRKAYNIICTHCHYDHIGGIPEFNSAPRLGIWASAQGRPYITDPAKLSAASLCAYVGMTVPQFSITNWAEDDVRVTTPNGEDLGLVIYQTPGHMPDQVAIWDAQERYLYVGDTLYQEAPILFPERASLTSYADTIRRLREMVHTWNTSEPSCRVKLSAGHITAAGDAEGLLRDVESFVDRVLAGDVPAVDLVEDSVYFGGQLAVGFKHEGSWVQFMGLKKSFEHLS